MTSLITLFSNCLGKYQTTKILDKWRIPFYFLFNRK